MNRSIRLLAACGLLAAVSSPCLVRAQNTAPKDAAGQVAPAGTAVAPPRGTADGGTRPPTDATGQTAPAGTPLAPSRLATPNATPSPPATNRP